MCDWGDYPVKGGVLFLVRSLNRGGAELQLVTLAKCLNARRYPVTVASFYAGGQLEEELRDGGVPVYVLNKRGRWDIGPFLWKLTWFLRKRRPAVVHSYLGAANILAVLLKPLYSGPRVVWGVRSSYMDLSMYDWLWRVEYRIARLLSRFPDRIVVNSRVGLELLQAEGYPLDRLVLIPNGIDTERYKPTLHASPSIRAEWGVQDHERLIGIAGRLDPMKDHPTFLQAAAELVKTRRDVRFICVGDGRGEYKAILQSLAADLGLGETVVWAGERSDMTAVYNALDIATSSSYGEGFSNAVAEAMACGIPCVVTDVGDSAWIVEDTGIVVPPKNPEALAKGWEECLRRDRVEMGRRARERIVANFSVDKLVDETVRVLEMLIQKEER